MPFLIWGLIELYETTFETDYLQTALDLNQILIEHFWEQETGRILFLQPTMENRFLFASRKSMMEPFLQETQSLLFEPAAPWGE